VGKERPGGNPPVEEEVGGKVKIAFNLDRPWSWWNFDLGKGT